MSRISKSELVLPALYLINQRPNIPTSDLIVELTKMLWPSGEDLEILVGRNDTKFSQKVRNLVSHKTLDKRYGYVKSKEVDRYWYHELTDLGHEYLQAHQEELQSLLLRRALTGSEAGLSQEDQIFFALRKMVDSDGRASINAIYDAVQSEMSGLSLSDQGKASLRNIINTTAVHKGYVFPHEDGQSFWRITPLGRMFVDERKLAEGVEEENFVVDESDISSQNGQSYLPYDVTKIRIDSTAFTVFQIMRKIQLGEIDLQPEFQRHVIWDETRQSRLIESILLRIPLPAFYLDGTDDNKWLVVDGLQKLFTLDKFYNKNELELRNLQFLQDINGKRFKDLPRSYQRTIEDYTKLNIYLIQPDTPPEVKFTIFNRVNTGGLILSAQEIRHALFQGSGTKLLELLANSPEFLSATSRSINTKRMDDRECVLRFLSFYLKPFQDNYSRPDLDGFLSETMQYLNAQNSSFIEELKGIFAESMVKAKKVFGEYAFRKLYEVNGAKYPINKSLFEVWSVSLTRYSLAQLQNYKEQILEKFVDLMNTNSDFNKAISQGTGSIQNVFKRFNAINELLQEVFNDH